jgi:hypothetical protein
MFAQSIESRMRSTLLSGLDGGGDSFGGHDPDGFFRGVGAGDFAPSGGNGQGGIGIEVEAGGGASSFLPQATSTATQMAMTMITVRSSFGRIV